MSKLGTLEITGKSGQKYSFDVFPSDENFSGTIACVYYVSKRTKKQDGTGGDHKAIYVGQTGDLASRFGNHHKQTCFDGHDYNAISIHKEKNEYSRIAIEGDLIESINPPCND